MAIVHQDRRCTPAIRDRSEVRAQPAPNDDGYGVVLGAGAALSGGAGGGAGSDVISSAPPCPAVRAMAIQNPTNSPTTNPMRNFMLILR